MAPSGGEQENWADTAEDARVTERSQEKEEERLLAFSPLRK